MMNSDEFLDYYNKIDAFIKKSEGYDSYETFSQKIKKSSNKVVRRYKDDLLSYGELRNAIVHNPRIGEKAIAEPHDETVAKIKDIYEKITNPKKVIPEFQCEVSGANEDDYINELLILINKNSYSQFPVFNKEGHVIELINTNTISRWLAKHFEKNGTMIIEDVKVKDLIPEIEFKKNYKFISKNASIYDTYYLFIDQINNKQTKLDVLFITESGKPTEKLLGLVTIEDIATII